MGYRKTGQFRASGDGGSNATVVVLTDLSAIETTKSGRWSSLVDAPKRYELADGTTLNRLSKGVYQNPASGITYRSSDPNAS